MKRKIRSLIFDLFHFNLFDGFWVCVDAIKNLSLRKPIYLLQYGLYQFFHGEYPWLTPQANAVLVKNLRPSMKGFEWGVGKSTLFFSKRVNHLVSIEHDPNWFRYEASMLKEKSIKNVDLRFVPPTKEENMESIDWKVEWPGYKYVQKPPKNPDFFDYFNAINDYPNEYFDFVLVDGQARVACIFNALPKIRKGGLLILDDADNPEYAQVVPFIKARKLIKTTNYLKDTNIWVC